MKQEQLKRRNVLRFTHFSHKSYALFSVLGREVLVGVLAVSTLTHAKAEGISIETASALDSLNRKEMKLDEVVITGSRVPLTQMQSAKIVSVVTREDIHRAAAESINDVLKLVTGVDVRQRGGFGVQTDISLRGGNFDQISILLNGTNISSPHTGHLSADFPVSADDIERIEILEGAYERGLCGVMNIITKNGNDDNYVNLQGGSYAFFNVNGGYGTVINTDSYRVSTRLSAGYSQSDGATPNSSFSSARCFWQGAMQTKWFDMDASIGYSYKPYEANTFYGSSSTDQWESNERIITALNIGHNWNNKAALTASAYWNKWYDHYQWHRNNPAGENFHDVDARAVTLNGWMESLLGKTSITAELRNEAIWSTKLGLSQEEEKWRKVAGIGKRDDVVYKYYDNRNIFTLSAEHIILLNKWTLSLAANATNVHLGGWNLYPNIDIAYRPAKSWRLYVSFNKAMRLPTFTDLYYGGKGIEGNSNLLPEKTSDIQLGARYITKGLSTEAVLFHSHKTNMIDWIQYAEAMDDIYHSVNFLLDNYGAEINTSFMPQEILGERCPLNKVEIKFTHLNQDSKYDVEMIRSKYAMEYLRNKLVVSANTRIWKNIHINLSWRWQDRIGEDNPSYSILDGRLSWNSKRFNVYLDATNILNKKYYDYVSVLQPGTVIVGGIKCRL